MKTATKIKPLIFTLEDLVHPQKNEPLKVGIMPNKTSGEGISSENMWCAYNSILSACAQPQLHILVAPEYAFFPSSGPLSASTVQKYLKSFKEASLDHGILLLPGTFIWEKKGKLYNSCFAIYNGKIIYRYDKYHDGGEFTIARKYGLTPKYGQKLGLFEWENLKLGLEICADSTLLFNHGIHDRDLLFFLSCGCYENSLKSSMGALNSQGYGVMAEGLLNKHLVIKAIGPGRSFQGKYLNPDPQKNH